MRPNKIAEAEKKKNEQNSPAEAVPIEAPEWHKEILDERRQRVADGTAHFEDWENAKAKIREKLR